jgi:serine/threonine protein kinase
MQKQIGEYLLRHQIGAGSYGKVHLAENTKTKVQVAMKIIPNRMFIKSKNLEMFVKNEI